MGSLAVLLSQSAGANTNNASDKNLPTPATALAELNDSDYTLEVLQSRDTLLASEMELEQALRTKAEALGIPTRPHTPIRNISGTEANSPLSSHARNTSSGSEDSTDTALTTMPPSPTAPCAEPSLPPSPRTRTRCLTFSQYDKYLAQVEPNLNQPKFPKQTISTADVVPNIFSVTSRRSVVSITNGIKARVRWRKRASMPTTATMYACPPLPVPQMRLSFSRNPVCSHVLAPVHAYVVETISANKTTSSPSRAVIHTARTVYGS